MFLRGCYASIRFRTLPQVNSSSRQSAAERLYPLQSKILCLRIPSFQHHFSLSQEGVRSASDLYFCSKEALQSASLESIFYKREMLSPELSLGEVGILPGSIVEYREVLLRARTSSIEAIVLAVSGRVAAVKAEVAMKLRFPLRELIGHNEMQKMEAEKVVQPSDSYIWVKSSFDRIRVPLLDFSVSARQILDQFFSTTASRFDWLLFNGNLLESDYPLDHYSVHSGAELQLVKASSHTLLLVIASDTRCFFTVKKTDTVARLKRLISRKRRIAIKKMTLFSRGAQLELDSQICSLADACIQLVSEGERMLTVRDRDQRTIFLPWKPGKSLASLKARLSEEWSVPISELNLVCKGARICEDSQLSDCKMNCCLTVCRPGEHFLLLKTCHTNQVCLHLPTLDLTVSELLSHCRARLPDAHSLLFHHTHLQEAKKLSECGVTNGATLTVLNGTNAQITVSDLAGWSLHVVMEEGTTVSLLKRTIQAKRGVPSKLQTLIVDNEELADTALVSSVQASIRSCLTLVSPTDDFAYVLSIDAQRKVVLFDHSDTYFSAAVSRVFGIAPEHFILVYESYLFRKHCSCIQRGGCITLFRDTDEYLAARLSNSVIVSTRVLPTATIASVLFALKLPRESRLRIDGVTLNEKRTVADYWITPCTPIDVFRRKDSIITVKTLTRGTATVVLKPNATLQMLKARLEERLGVESSKMMIIANETLCRDEAPMYLIANLLMLVVGDACFQVMSLHSELVTVLLTTEHRISDIKKALSRQLSRPASSLRLLYTDCLLEDDSLRIAECRLPPLCRITVLFPEDLLVTVVTSTTQMKFAMKSTATVCALKTQMKERRFAWSRNERFSCNGTALYDTDVLEKCGAGDYAVVLCVDHEQLLVVRSSGGKFITITQQLSLAELLSAVQEKTGLPRGRQAFSCVAELCNESLVSDYSLATDSTLLLTTNLTNTAQQNSEFFITIRHFSYIQVSALSNDSIASVKKSIEQQGIKGDFRLIVSGEIADCRRTLADYGVYTETVVDIALHKDGIATIVLPGGAKLCIAFSPSTTVANIKYELRKITSIPETLQVLRMGALHLSNDTVLRILGSDLELHLTPRKDMIVVETTNGTRTAIHINLIESVMRLKEIIAGQIACHASHQQLYYGDKLLTEQHSLKTTGLVSGCIVTLLFPGEIRLYVKSSLSPALSIYCKKKQSVLELKTAVSRLIKIDHDEMRLSALVQTVNERNANAIFNWKTPLNLTLRLSLPCDWIVVLIRLAGTEAYPLQVAMNETIAEVKKRVKTVVTVDNIRLFYEDRELHDSQTVAQSNLALLSNITYSSS